MTTSNVPMRRLTRREMLKLSGSLMASAALAACVPPPAPGPAAPPATPAVATVAPPPPAQGNVVVMHFRHELTEDHENQFEADNPGITIEFVQADATKFFAMYAAGNPPDLLRTQAPAIPQYLARHMLYDLTPYFETSEVLKLEDLAPANNYYRANSPLEIGQGPIYGMCKDWSPDHTLFIYKKAFEDAGVPIPSDTTPLTYQEIFELARKLAKFEGDRTLMFGYGYGDWWVDRIWMNMAAELGKSLYAEDFSKIILAGDEDIRAIAKWYFDLAKEKLVASPLNPSPSWNGEDFTKGTLAILQYGYWFSAMAESDITKGQVMMLPAPTWAGVRRNPTITATGMVMAAATKVPDAAWKVFEWYNGREPAIERAKSGWGVPALKSLYNLMPKETEYQQQVQRVLQGELALETPPIQFSPFLGETTVADTWAKYLPQALQDEITFDELLQNVENDVNQAIKEGIDRLL